MAFPTGGGGPYGMPPGMRPQHAQFNNPFGGMPGRCLRNKQIHIHFIYHVYGKVIG